MPLFIFAKLIGPVDKKRSGLKVVAFNPDFQLFSIDQAVLYTTPDDLQKHLLE